MAKRAAADEEPYRPLLNTRLVNSVVAQAGPSATGTNRETVPSAPAAKVVDIPRAEVTPPRVQQPPIEPGPTKAPSRSSLGPERDWEQHTPSTTPEKFEYEKRVLFNRGELQAIDRLIVALADRFDTPVKASHVIRSLVGLLLHAEAEV